MSREYYGLRAVTAGDRNTFRYLRSAIGELLLIIVGILVALQIDNWNESRKEAAQEAIYYCKIEEDLSADVRNIERSLASLDERAAAARRLLKNLLELQPDQAVIFGDYLAAVRSLQYVPSRAAIDDITYSGKLGLLRDVSLKKAILEHYTQQNVALSVVEKNAVRMIDKIFDTRDYTEFGYPHIELYREDFGPELLPLMPTSNWHTDSESRLYQHLRDHLTMTIIICAREIQLLKGILESTQRLQSNLQTGC